MSLPNSLEQEQLELLNRMRLDPQQELTILLQDVASVQSGDPAVQAALDYFNVDGAVLAAQWAQLVAVQPLAWSPLLADAAAGHNAEMVEHDTQSHQLPGELSLGGRVTAVGWKPQTGAWQVGENAYAYAESMLYGHAGFAIDWGNTATGIQPTAGHRSNIMNGIYREVGISVLAENSGATDVGPYLITQDFGYRSVASSPYLLGVAFNDLNGDGWYQAGEGRAGITVSAGPAGTTSTWQSGGYQVQHSGGPLAVTFSGGDLANAISITVAPSTQNVKVDLVGDTLRSSGSITLGAGAGDLDLIGTLATDAVGNGAANTILGNIAANRIDGAAGDDLIIAEAGNDQVSGGSGSDLAYGDTGDDSIYGGAGLDTIYGGDGNDGLAGGADEDRVYGGEGADWIYAAEGQDQSWGGNGSDVIFAEHGDDMQYGGEDGDYLSGGDGRDTLHGMSGTDQLMGNADGDVIYGGSHDDLVDGGTGNDLLVDESGTDALFGGAGDDTAYGGAGGDWIDGGAGRDLADAGEGNDVLFGGADDDSLYGSAGDDVVDGGGGADLLVGGAGADVFGVADDGAADLYALRPGDSGWDMVSEFEDGLDRILLAGFGFTSFAGFLAGGGFIERPAAGAAGGNVAIGVVNPAQSVDVRMTISLDVGETLDAADVLFG
jgi:Ca2+-binding RTX toxin-like protein